MYADLIPALTIRIFLPIFLGMPVIAAAIVIYIILHPTLWILLLFYSAWYIYDRKTPWKGSRSNYFFRSLPFWRYCAKYFDLEIIKTIDLPTDKNYIFACHPHGVLGISTILSFGTESTGLSEKFKGLKFNLVTLPVNFNVPIHRDVFSLMGLISSDAESIEYALKMEAQGRAVAIVPGGAEESLDSHSYNYDLTLKERKGFVKLAIKTGASLVPVYQFGETGTYHQIPNERGTFVRRIQQTVKNVTGISPLIVSGEGFFNKYFGIIPKKVKITTVVGAPIHTNQNPNPTNEEITHLHGRYVAALVDLFEENKRKYKVPEQARLRIL